MKEVDCRQILCCLSYEGSPSINLLVVKILAYKIGKRQKRKNLLITNVSKEGGTGMWVLLPGCGRMKTGLAFLEGDLSERTEKQFGLKCSYEAIHLDAVYKREELRQPKCPNIR